MLTSQGEVCRIVLRLIADLTGRQDVASSAILLEVVDESAIAQILQELVCSSDVDMLVSGHAQMINSDIRHRIVAQTTVDNFASMLVGDAGADGKRIMSMIAATPPPQTSATN